MTSGGWDWQGRPGISRWGEAGRGKVGRAWMVILWLGGALMGMEWQARSAWARHSLDRHGGNWQGRLGETRTGLACLGKVEHGKAGNW